MFDTSKRNTGCLRRQLRQHCLINRVHVSWPAGTSQSFPSTKDHYKFDLERRPHPAYLYYRDVHPRYYHTHYNRGAPHRLRLIVLKEAWVVKIERNSPRAMRSQPVTVPVTF